MDVLLDQNEISFFIGKEIDNEISTNKGDLREILRIRQRGLADISKEFPQKFEKMLLRVFDDHCHDNIVSWFVDLEGQAKSIPPRSNPWGHQETGIPCQEVVSLVTKKLETLNPLKSLPDFCLEVLKPPTDCNPPQDWLVLKSCEFFARDILSPEKTLSYDESMSFLKTFLDDFNWEVKRYIETSVDPQRYPNKNGLKALFAAELNSIRIDSEAAIMIQEDISLRYDVSGVPHGQLLKLSEAAIELTKLAASGQLDLLNSVDILDSFLNQEAVTTFLDTITP